MKNKEFLDAVVDLAKKADRNEITNERDVLFVVTKNSMPDGEPEFNCIIMARTEELMATLGVIFKMNHQLRLIVEATFQQMDKIDKEDAIAEKMQQLKTKMQILKGTDNKSDIN